MATTGRRRRFKWATPDRILGAPLTITLPGEGQSQVRIFYETVPTRFGTCSG